MRQREGLTVVWGLSIMRQIARRYGCYQIKKADYAERINFYWVGFLCFCGLGGISAYMLLKGYASLKMKSKRMVDTYGHR
jgi:hypothetical protein